jgi:hypothetical protein
LNAGGGQTPGLGPIAPVRPGVRAVPPSRSASFNIQVFGAAKEQNRPVMQTLASVIGRFEIIAIQEIRIDDDYLLRRFLDQYLNSISGRRYDYVPSANGWDAPPARNNTLLSTTRTASR